MCPTSNTQQAVQPRRQELLSIARALFIQDGYARTPVSAIVRNAGVAQGTFYLYFANKQELLVELRREVFHDYERTLHDTLALPRPNDARVARVLVAMAEAVSRNLQMERVFRLAESAEATLHIAREGRARLARTAAEHLQTGVEDGSFHVHNPALTARFIITLLDNLLYEALAYESERFDDIVAESIRFTLQALGVNPERIQDLVEQRGEWLDHLPQHATGASLDDSVSDTNTHNPSKLK